MSSFADLPTIFAPATGYGRGALSVVRVSGSLAFHSLHALTGFQNFEPRKAHLREIKNPKTGVLIDKALIISFKAPHSFTGEDVVEYHLHGGTSVLDALLEALSLFENHRLAEAGEFTKRGFEHEKFDLCEAEAIADLIAAQTEAQRLQALGQLSGGLSKLYEGWALRLTKLLALMEADLDFSDQDLPDDILLKIRPNLDDLIDEIENHLDDKNAGERLRSGFTLALLGAPNVGKSSLLNALAKRDMALVSPHAGTTRDIVEAQLDIHGYPVILADMAGIRSFETLQNPTDEIEKMGIENAQKRAGEADIILHVFDGTRLPNFEREILKTVSQSSLFIITKKDLINKNISIPHEIKNPILLSSQTGEGMAELKIEIAKKIKTILPNQDNSYSPLLTRARHREALIKAHKALTRIADAKLPELAAEDVRLALRALGAITGRVDVEDILDIIFKDFCIGK